MKLVSALPFEESPCHARESDSDKRRQHECQECVGYYVTDKFSELGLGCDDDHNEHWDTQQNVCASMSCLYTSKNGRQPCPKVVCIQLMTSTLKPFTIHLHQTRQKPAKNRNRTEATEILPYSLLADAF